MYTIKKCTEVLDTQIFQAFQDGFCDYMIQIKMDQDTFIKKFFECEGNKKNLSVIAFRDHKPVGITLGGIKTTESIKTLRCGGMAVIPEERGTGLARELMEYHKNIAIENGCKQLFLEVIDTNNRAINFYEKLGYEKVYNINYYKFNCNKFDLSSLTDTKVVPITLDDVKSLIKTSHSHLPWQSDYPYFNKLNSLYYGIRIDDELVAGIAANENRVFFLWVNPLKRCKGYAKALLNKIISCTNTKELNFTYTNNSSFHTFCKHYDMEKNIIGQFEMYKWMG